MKIKITNTPVPKKKDSKEIDKPKYVTYRVAKDPFEDYDSTQTKQISGHTIKPRK